jgi:hypothetical protein
VKQKKRILSILFLGGFWIVAVQGQETILATGGNANGIGGSVSYTIGQSAFEAFKGTNGSVVQGVQQPYEISVLTGIENTKEIDLKCIVYPNPTRSVIKLLIESSELEKMRFQLFDINGIIIRDKKVENKETEISMDNLVPSTYFLRVINDKQEVKTFKIIKN